MMSLLWIENTHLISIWISESNKRMWYIHNGNGNVLAIFTVFLSHKLAAHSNQTPSHNS